MEYDGADAEHVSALERLWGHAFPREPFTAVRNARWADMGWQRDDPASDFRGAGYIALELHLYMAEASIIFWDELQPQDATFAPFASQSYVIMKTYDRLPRHSI